MIAQTSASQPRLRFPADSEPSGQQTGGQIVLSFDVEEHYRIEAAAALIPLDSGLKRHYRLRLDRSTRWILDELARFDIKATFFVVGEIARKQPGLVRAIHKAGHEVASHGWDHRRVHSFNPASFANDVRKSRDALEEVTGCPVVGYRAPTFSVTHETAWALDVLADQGMGYDSSIFPVRHDRYGVPRAPRSPFLARGELHSILELPPATLRLLGMNVPIGGGGYFRLLPLFLMEYALRQIARQCRPAVAMLYFHPWEFDPQQARLPLTRISRFRTYVGLDSSQARLTKLLSRHAFCRGVDVAAGLLQQQALVEFSPAASGRAGGDAERPQASLSREPAGRYGGQWPPLPLLGLESSGAGEPA